MINLRTWSWGDSSSFSFFFFFFSFWAAPKHMEFLGQGSDLSRSLNLSAVAATPDS